MTKRQTRGLYHGYLIIDKPAGMTSHDVVGRVRRVLGERRVGHAGTLDPAAVGVLPIAVGLATKTVEYLSDASKSYLAEITFGIRTDSHDIDGTVTEISDTSALTRGIVDQAVRSFIGEQMQVPPMHSAIKIGGQRMYELAHRGESVDLPARPITIHAISLESWDPPVAEIFVHCSKGTYIRSLARDLGDLMGTGAYMSNLVRVQTGPFTLADAIRIHDLEEMIATESWENIAAHPDASLLDWQAIILGAEDAGLWRNGTNVHVAGAAGAVRVYDDRGNWMGVGDGADDIVRPTKVVLES
jgi:tRNA pseudouridine55 synthase